MDDGYVSATWQCHADEGGDCRLTCPAGCESWNIGDHEHELVDAGKCLVIEWLEEMELEESHHGHVTLYSGRFDYEWDGDGYIFTFPFHPKMAPKAVSK
jgi:hypothetical protein